MGKIFQNKRETQEQSRHPGQEGLPCSFKFFAILHLRSAPAPGVTDDARVGGSQDQAEQGELLTWGGQKQSNSWEELTP